MEKKKLIVITGPTATGKTAAAVEIAKRMDGEIVSADSMQIYDVLSIGTARPTADEMQGIPHHLVGFVDPSEKYSAGKFQKDALECIENISERGKQPILVGGTGLYINAVTYDMDFSAPERDAEKNSRYLKLYNEEGPDAAYGLLKKKDPDAAARIHKNDRMRVVRALEVADSPSGTGYDFRRPSERYDFRIFALTKDRARLYSDIEKRVDIMFERGLEKEVRELRERYGDDIQAFQAIGYKEFIPYFNGEIDIDKVRELIKRNTRRYAKRQLTWLRPDSRVNWIYTDRVSCAADEICDIIRKIDEQGG